MASDPASTAVARPGRAIFLVGPSSSGKSAIARELMATLPDPWYFYESDFTQTFHAPTDRFELATPEMERRLTYGTALALRGYLELDSTSSSSGRFGGPGFALRTLRCSRTARRISSDLIGSFESWNFGSGAGPMASSAERRGGKRWDGVPTLGTCPSTSESTPPRTLRASALV